MKNLRKQFKEEASTIPRFSKKWTTRIHQGQAVVRTTCLDDEKYIKANFSQEVLMTPGKIPTYTQTIIMSSDIYSKEYRKLRQKFNDDVYNLKQQYGDTADYDETSELVELHNEPACRQDLIDDCINGELNIDLSKGTPEAAKFLKKKLPVGFTIEDGILTCTLALVDAVDINRVILIPTEKVTSEKVTAERVRGGIRPGNINKYGRRK